MNQKTPMATNTFVEINIPEATELADLTGIVHDFESAKQFATQLKEMFERQPPNYDGSAKCHAAVAAQNRAGTRNETSWLTTERTRCMNCA